ncbi:MAG: hypothetical protein WKF77_03225 [Planctomycetaceae bacterium]
MQRSILFHKSPPKQALVPGADQDYQHWSRLLLMLTDKQWYDLEFHFNRCRETKLDECPGACVLKRPELAKIVADSLQHFDCNLYRMGDFVVMPNHVHLLAVFATPDAARHRLCDGVHRQVARRDDVLRQGRAAGARRWRRGG